MASGDGVSVAMMKSAISRYSGSRAANKLRTSASPPVAVRFGLPRGGGGISLNPRPECFRSSGQPHNKAARLQELPVRVAEESPRRRWRSRIAVRAQFRECGGLAVAKPGFRPSVAKISAMDFPATASMRSSTSAKLQRSCPARCWPVVVLPVQREPIRMMLDIVRVTETEARDTENSQLFRLRVPVFCSSERLLVASSNAFVSGDKALRTMTRISFGVGRHSGKEFNLPRGLAHEHVHPGDGVGAAHAAPRGSVGLFPGVNGVEDRCAGLQNAEVARGFVHVRVHPDRRAVDKHVERNAMAGVPVDRAALHFFRERLRAFVGTAGDSEVRSSRCNAYAMARATPPAPSISTEI